MKLKTIHIPSLLLALLLSLSACQPKQSTNAPSMANAEGVHQVQLKEVIQGAQYTYALVSEGDAEYWLATAKADLQQGKHYYYSDGIEMTQFHSKELDRTFESIVFVDVLSTEPGQAPAGAAHGGMPGMGSQQTMGAPGMEKAQISVEAVAGGTRIGDLYAKKAQLSGKSIKVSGQVVKVNNGIMGSNWVHIQDGTEHEGQFDLTVTTQEEFQVGDKVVFEGKVTLDKDFGYGYKYPVILENASGKPSRQL